MPPVTHDIIGLGVVAVDDMLFVDSYPPADGKRFVLECRRHGGGNTSCALAAAARLGSRCAMLGRLGDCDLSMFARRELSRIGIDLSLLLHDSSCGPIHATIVVARDTGSRAIFADKSVTRPLEAAELSVEWFRGAKVLLVDHLHPPAILPALRIARAAGLQTVSDIEIEMPQLAEMRAVIDHFICSAEFALPHTRTERPEDACRVLSQGNPHQTVIVTAGQDGCYWSLPANDAVQHLPAHLVEPVDTTGCGDVFHGVFCHGLAAGWQLDRTIRFANAAAAIKATRTGGWAAVPSLSEIERIVP